VKSLVSVVVRSEAGLKNSRRSSFRLLSLAPAALLVSGLFSVWAGPLAAPAAAASGDWTQSYNGPTDEGYITAAPAAAAHRKGGPLTPRLQLLADPAFETASAEAQAEKLMLSVSGPGSIMKRPGGRILVDVRVSDTSAATLARMKASGVNLVYVDDALRVVTAEVAPSGLNALAAVQPQVLSVEEVLQPEVNAACPTGDFVSEGDTQLNAATGRTHYSVNGSGITVGVLSDSYNSLGGASTDVTNGELPGTTNP
jgi:hypothetical protein